MSYKTEHSANSGVKRPLTLPSPPQSRWRGDTVERGQYTRLFANEEIDNGITLYPTKLPVDVKRALG